MYKINMLNASNNMKYIIVLLIKNYWINMVKNHGVYYWNHKKMKKVD